MGRYWRVTAETMLCGMDRDEVFECEDKKKAHDIAAQITDDNAAEWWDPEDSEFIGIDEDEWFGEVGYTLVEITYEEFIEEGGICQ